jgi:endoglucanase
MHPREDWMFNQIADDRDHISMRRPGLDSQYNKGYERPVYFINGEPQGLFQYKNRTLGTSSSAAKFSSAFALGYTLFADRDATYAQRLFERMGSALTYANKKPGVTQTAPGRAPYFYEEDNWVDDMELAYAAGAAAMNTFNKTARTGFQHQPVRVPLDNALMYASKEPHTPWLGADTARHYQWYPFINLGHYELAKQLKGAQRDTVVRYYREGIQKVWNKAKANAFYRGVPFIWCSNNLTASFATQCYWYKQLSGDHQFEDLEQANFDWLFGLNPWGTSMVYGLPAWGDTPVDPHSWFTHGGKYPIDGGLVDGPVYGSIYGNLKGITLYNKDAYAEFQSPLAVYHDDYGDYSTNEPTMDGTASLIYLLAAKEAEGRPAPVKKK